MRARRPRFDRACGVCGSTWVATQRHADTSIQRRRVRGQHKPGSGSRLADRELANLVAEVAKGSVLATGTETVDDLLAEWLDHCESLGRSPTTLRKYRSIAETVVKPELGKIRLSRLTAHDLNRLYAKLTAKGNKATTVRRVHALLSAALHYARKRRHGRSRTSRSESPAAGGAGGPDRGPDPAEVQAILSRGRQDPGLATLLLLAALTGARRGELCGLRWPDIDFAAQTVAIARSIYETDGGGWGEKSTKTHQSRTVGLAMAWLQALRRHRAAVESLAGSLELDVLDDGFVFSRSPVGAEPIRPDVVTKFTKRAAESAGVDTHLHTLRHFSATQAIAAGFDPVTVGGRLRARRPVNYPAGLLPRPRTARSRTCARPWAALCRCPRGHDWLTPQGHPLTGQTAIDPAKAGEWPQWSPTTPNTRLRARRPDATDDLKTLPVAEVEKRLGRPPTASPRSRRTKRLDAVRAE